MESKRTYLVQANGSIELPDWFRQKYNIKPGDEVGLLVAPRVELVNQLLDQIGAGLIARGITLDDLMESGHDIRGEILKEDYGIEAGDDD